MDKKLSFSVDNIEISDEKNDSQFALLKIDAFASGDNRHHLPVSEETLKKTAFSIYHKPIIWSYSRLYDDIDTHGEQNVPCGFVHKNNPTFRTLSDGRMMMTVEAVIWKRYSGQLMDILERDGGKKSVSVEIEVIDLDESTREIKDYRYSAITMLGDHISPAIPDASSDVVKFSKEYKDAVISEFSFDYKDIDLSIPQQVKDAAFRGLNLYNEYKRGGNSVSLANARFITKNSHVTPERVRNMYKFFSKSKFSEKNLENNPSDELITWLLWGGKEGWNWSSSIIKQMDEVDNMRKSYYSNEDKTVYLEDNTIGFPYKNVGDMNPALRGITPPITVAQGNEIARQADGIGAENGGWGIAISNFKKTHKVVDGKWIKKVDNSDESEGSKMEQEEKIEIEIEKENPAEESPQESEEQVEEVEEEKETEEMSVEEKEESIEENKATMSSDEYADVAAMLSMLGVETYQMQEEAAKYMLESGSYDFKRMAQDMAKKSHELMSRVSELENAVKDLNDFKNGVEQKEFSFIVDSTLKEVEEFMPREEIDAARNESSNFSLLTIEAWRNSVKAKAFEFGKKQKKSDSGITAIGMPFAGKPKKNDSLWE